MSETIDIEQLKKENTILRGLVAKLPIPCVYCGQPNMAQCPSGFPGCAMADDMMAADDEVSRRLLKERQELRDELKRLHDKYQTESLKHWNQWSRIAYGEAQDDFTYLRQRFSL